MEVQIVMPAQLQATAIPPSEVKEVLPSNHCCRCSDCGFLKHVPCLFCMNCSKLLIERNSANQHRHEQPCSKCSCGLWCGC